MTHLLLTVRFLDKRYHGLLDRGGPSEWPPSPYRVFQALVAGVARRGELVIGEDVPTNTQFTPIGKALAWLQRHTREHPPVIISPRAKTGQAVISYGPNNDSNSTKFQQEPEKYRTGKHIEPTLFLLESDQKPEVHYAWDISGKSDCPVDDIERAARGLTTLGWGIDMAFADARLTNVLELNRLFEIENTCTDEMSKPKNRKWITWYPKKNAGSFYDTLRTPTYDDKLAECTLCDLRRCHNTFINRNETKKWLHTVDKPQVFDRVLYTSSERSIRNPNAIFRLKFVDKETGEELRRGYPHSKLIHVAGMTRHAAIEAMRNFCPKEHENDPNWIDTFICGHRGKDSKSPHLQLSYIPLPSIGHEHADALIRNVMIVAPFGCDRELEHVAAQLDGIELEPEVPLYLPDPRNTTPKLPSRLFIERFNPPPGKFIAEHYLNTSRTWHSVTPVILPGHDEHKPVQAKKLILKALSQSGIETPCTFTWSALPTFKNCLTAHKYDRNKQHIGYYRPNHLNHFTAKHVSLTFDHPISGPLAIGAGRHCGLGICATD